MMDDLEAAADQAIAECDGDARAAVRSLILANAYLSAEVDRLAAAISAGFMRGQLRREGPLAQHGEQGDCRQDQEEENTDIPDADAKPFKRRQ